MLLSNVRIERLGATDIWLLLNSAYVLTNEQVKIFVEKTIQTDFARKILSGMKPQDSGTATAQTVGNGAGKVG